MVALSVVGSFNVGRDGHRWELGSINVGVCHTANTLISQGKYNEANPLSMRAVDIVERALGPDHPDLAGILFSRANLMKDQVWESVPEDLTRFVKVASL